MHKKTVCEDCNVILISIDTLRADSLPCYGYKRDTAPNICKFARENILFTNSFSNAASTLPSHFSIFTGLYPSGHGVTQTFKKKLNENITTLPGLFKENGYETVFSGPTGDNNLPLDNSLGDSFSVIVQDDWEAAISIFENNTEEDKKTFLFLHTYDIHSPYISMNTAPMFTDKTVKSIPATEDDYKNFDQELWDTTISSLQLRLKESDTEESRLRNKKNLDQMTSAKNLKEAEAAFNSLPEIEIQSAWDERYYKSILNTNEQGKNNFLEALYDENIYRFDTQVFSNFISRLESSGVLENTIVVITSDHGEAFGEHDNYIHGGTLYRETTKVPLIMHTPGISGTKIKGLVQGIDIYPTLISLTGLKAPEWLQGIDLVGMINNNFFAKRNKYLVAESYGLLYRSIQNGVWKLQVHTPAEEPGDKYYELYNLILDPGEKVNLAKYMPIFRMYMEHKMSKILSHKPEFEAVDIGFPDWIDEVKREKLKKEGYF